ncbi:hypothetical protein ATCC90586_002152 [Pythium insidiosum]|nr:hypothetical protein ATCC90586_002152 [Pythium insidiosum]
MGDDNPKGPPSPTAMAQPAPAAMSPSHPHARHQSIIRRLTRKIESGQIPLPNFHTKVGAPVFLLVWGAVLLVHAFCAVFLGCIAVLYFYLLGTALVGYLTLYSIAPDPFYFPPIAVGYFMVCGIHVFVVVTMLFHSLRSQRSAFTSSQFSNRMVTTPRIRIRRMSASAFSSLEYRTQSVLDRLPSPVVRVLFRLWRAMVLTYRYSAIKMECYGSVFATRQLLQTAAHTHQLFLASTYLTETWVSDLWVGLLVANAWLTPVLQYVFRRDLPRIRLVCVAINVAVDLVAVIGIPLALFLPYYRQYDPAEANFPQTFWYTELSCVRFINDARFLLVNTPADGLSKLTIAYNASRGLRVIPTMLVRVQPDEVAPEPAQDPSTASPLRGTRRSVGSDSTNASGTTSVRPSLAVVPVAKSTHSTVEWVSTRMLVLLGALVLAAHVQSGSAPAAAHGCRMPARPWFASKPVCMFLEFRCTANATYTGAAHELEAYLTQYATNRVSFLAIRSCPQVEMPPTISELQALVGVKLFRSVISRWGDDAALTADGHPNLRFVYLVDVNATEFPLGLQSTRFPPLLHDLEVCRTNLTALPGRLAEILAPNMNLVFEFAQFETFPEVLARAKPSSLSLTGNQITAVPRAVLENPQLFFLVLNGNPIRELPTHVKFSPRLFWISIAHTLVAELPSEYAYLLIDADGSPLCAPRNTSLDVDCGAVDVDSMSMYPIELEETLNGY